MRLINTTTWAMEEFIGTPPPYAILSHTWGDEEVSLADYGDPHVRWAKKGFRKIERACEQARRDDLGHCWVDTCCIDKSSSADLSEAINSMFAWYRDAAVCYAYLEDVETSDASDEFGRPDSSLARSRWFTRGWTLQELVAPRRVVFYNRDWVRLDDKASRVEELQSITGIWADALKEGGADNLNYFSVGMRMSWGANRQTTRVEDTAYSLLGIFDINMPLLYGEGAKAFTRLQEEIIRKYNDDTIFAWSDREPKWEGILARGLLATNPSAFSGFLHFEYYKFRGKSGRYPGFRLPLPVSGEQVRTSFSTSNNGIEVTGPCYEADTTAIVGLVMVLSCRAGTFGDAEVGVLLVRISGNRFARGGLLARDIPQKREMRTVNLVKTTSEALALNKGEPWLLGPLSRPNFTSTLGGLRGNIMTHFNCGFYIPKSHSLTSEGHSVVDIHDLPCGRRFRVSAPSTSQQDEEIILAPEGRSFSVLIASAKPRDTRVCVYLKQFPQPVEEGGDKEGSGPAVTACMKVAVYEPDRKHIDEGRWTRTHSTQVKYLHLKPGVESDVRRVGHRLEAEHGVEMDIWLEASKLDKWDVFRLGVCDSDASSGDLLR